MSKDNTRCESGMITVEAVLTLVPFVMVILGIITFINIFAVHNRIQYAMYQVANELSAYTYFYEAFGIRGAEIKFQNDADQETQELDQTIEDTTNFFSSLSQFSNDVSNIGSNGIGGLEQDMNNIQNSANATGQNFNQAVNSATTLVSDPEDMMRNVVFYILETALDEGKTALLGFVAKGMIGNYLDASYLEATPMTADQYLRWMGVVNGMDGLDFDNSKLFADSEHRMIDIVVEYDLEIYFFKLFLKEPTVHVVQRCAVPAWLDGDGNHY